MGGKKVFELMIEIGDRSTPLTKRMPNGYTHKWTAFIRGVNNSKIEHCIQRVVFQLHESFQSPERVLHDPPFQVRETGYAGFEIPIDVYFKNRDKKNHVMFLHDLVLLNDKPNSAIRTEKLKFINPNKDFEKCLIKAGAQLLPNPITKERSGSPPAKKQKSSSLIPSKDMSKQFQTTTTLAPAPTVVPTTNSNSLPNNQGPASKASENSKDFIDMFGAPLVFGGQQTTQSAVSQYPVNSVQTSAPTSNSTQSKHHHHHHHNHNTNHNHNHNHKPEHISKEESVKSHHHNNHQQQQQAAQQQQLLHENHQIKQEEPVDELQLIQTKISSLTDSNRLQKIVDIIEEAGEWFNLTSKKFEFDLKRLDKKTLSKIERTVRTMEHLGLDFGHCSGSKVCLDGDANYCCSASPFVNDIELRPDLKCCTFEDFSDQQWVTLASMKGYLILLSLLFLFSLVTIASFYLTSYKLSESEIKEYRRIILNHLLKKKNILKSHKSLKVKKHNR